MFIEASAAAAAFRFEGEVRFRLALLLSEVEEVVVVDRVWRVGGDGLSAVISMFCFMALK